MAEVHDISAKVRGARAAPDLTEGGGDDGGELRFVLPPGSPIKALGKQGLNLWLLDHINQLHSIKPRELGKGELVTLAGEEAWLLKNWPQLSESDWKKFHAAQERDQAVQPWEFAGKFDQNKAQVGVALACSAKGVFSPRGNLFGRGAHKRASDDALVMHLGNKVWIIGREKVSGGKATKLETFSTGEVDGKIYPQLPALPPPAAESSPRAEAQRLLDEFGNWYFADGAIAQTLLLGWLALAMMCGAADWRPHVLLTGETSAGKSTLQKLLRVLLDEWGLFSSEASEAAIRQMLGNDTLPVLLDEAEGDGAGNAADRAHAMINLARKASSGDKLHRGGADHNAKEFEAFSTFLLSCILHAPLDPQDRNRFVILPMRQIPNDAPELDMDLKYWREAGRRFHRRMIDQWPRYARTLGLYKTEIGAAGYQGRWRDTFGTLLACADMLLHDEAPGDDVINDDADSGRKLRWVQQCLPLLERSALEAESTTVRCERYLTSSLLPAMSGHHQETVGQWIKRAATISADTNDDGTHMYRAREKLKSHGLRLVNLTKGKDGAFGAHNATQADQIYVLIAGGTNTGMLEIFRTSKKWPNGAWMQALGESGYDTPEGRVAARKGIRARFTGKTEIAVAVPIEALIGPLGDMS